MGHEKNAFFLPVKRCKRRSGVAYLTCGSLHEFNVRENRISISSINRRGSECNDNCGPIEDALIEFKSYMNINTHNDNKYSR